MYILSKQEKGLLKSIIISARIDYFRKNKNILAESYILGEELYAKDNVEKDFENKLDNEIQACKLEDIFSDENLSKFAKALTYREKLVLSLYYVECKNDEEIADILFMTRSAVNKKRNRALEKIRKKIRGKDNV